MRGSLNSYAEQVPILTWYESLGWESMFDMARNFYESEDVRVWGVVAFVRHSFTDYPALVARLRGLTNSEEAYRIIKTRTNDKIVKYYELEV